VELDEVAADEQGLIGRQDQGPVHGPPGLVDGRPPGVIELGEDA
jgi:hypothetical protein